MPTTVAVQPKSIFRSRTFWFNSGVAVVALVTEIQAALPAFDGIVTIPPSVARWMLLVVTLGNIFLRRISDQPARFSPEGSPVPLETFKGPYNG